MDFSGKIIALGVTGGIAAYKACALVSLLKKSGADVHVVMTKNAREFVKPLTFETLSGNRVVCDTFARDFEYDVKHVSLAKKADVFAVAPATANFIAKFAHGIADDFLSTAIMAYAGLVLIAPAMNTAMLKSAANQENMGTLRRRGVRFIDAGDGMLACGDTGAGRLAEPPDIAARLYEILYPKQDFAGKTVLVTAGATREPIDPVRYISNRSSGKMGVAIAEAAARRGARVILIAANCAGLAGLNQIANYKLQITNEDGSLTVGREPGSTAVLPPRVIAGDGAMPPPYGTDSISAAPIAPIPSPTPPSSLLPPNSSLLSPHSSLLIHYPPSAIQVETTAEMYRAVMEHLPQADIIVKAAAPSDYGVEPAPQKIKSGQLTLKLTKNVDIAAEVGKQKGDKKLVVFAAETEDLIKNAKEKLKSKNADIIVANDVTKEGAGFSADTNIVTIISGTKTAAYEKMSKREVAEVILDWLSVEV